MTRRVQAWRDDSLTARVVRGVPLVFARGADATLDRPAHVRAASSLAWVGERLAVVQDDVNFVALVDPASGSAESVPLPRGPGGVRQFDDGRGNKNDKLDLEVLVNVPGASGPLLLAIGSGATSRRECFALLDGLHSTSAIATVAVHPAPAFFAVLRALERFSGAQLNLEGAIYLPDRLRLFGRGNGAARGILPPLDATCEVSWPALLAHLERPGSISPPALENVVQYALGAISGVRLTFTDATAGWGRPGNVGCQVIYTAAAEASPDAVSDGVVTGSSIGVIEVAEQGIDARWTELVDSDGRIVPAKVEGIARHPERSDAVFVVVDRDDHARPSELWQVALEGPWNRDR